ncbi:TerD family protein [Jeongeupia wiesaeckerbachi]|uniref:TerD family protein n=1 Tax=Jeongeupia wiesaeckerbachi TaxID=3051218 RepID=UPI003D8057D0
MSNKLELTLTKPGDAPVKLQLNLRKAEPFRIKLSWDEGNDLDLHALVATNSGQGAKVGSLDDILSVYNVKRAINGQNVGHLAQNTDGTFEVHGGALVHSKDATTGISDGVDEWIHVSPEKLPKAAPGTFIEIPLLSMVHPQDGRVHFRDVKNPRVEVVNSDGATVLNASLSDQFGGFKGAQLASLMVDADGKVEFAAVGVGFNDDFNAVLGHYC